MAKQRAVFIDTSVLVNLLKVPGKNQQALKAAQDFMALQEDSGVQFVLPVTAVIETGNHIAQLANGDTRRKIAETFGEVLELVTKSESPWVLHDFEWGEAFLDSFLNGAGTGQPWPELAQARLGGGDLSILVEAEMYRARLGIDYEIWTYDDGLRSYAPALTL